MALLNSVFGKVYLAVVAYTVVRLIMLDFPPKIILFLTYLVYIVLRGRWCNVHARIEEKSDNSKDSFYEELE
jgi:hypothetical protein